MFAQKKLFPSILTLLVFVSCAYSSAPAATITQTGTCNITSNNDACQSAATDLLATATVVIDTTSNDFTISFDLQNSNTTQSATLVAFTLQLFDSGFKLNSATFTGVPTGWDVVAG